MIARIWRGRIRASDVTAYREYIGATGLVDYRATPGNQGAYMLTRIGGETAHVITLSLWDRLESIRAFAGDDLTRARYYPQDERFLLEFPEHVEHFDVLGNSTNTPAK
jgi:heme-degrading monooxygenase HmoA